MARPPGAIHRLLLGDIGGNSPPGVRVSSDSGGFPAAGSAFFTFVGFCPLPERTHPDHPFSATASISPFMPSASALFGFAVADEPCFRSLPGLDRVTSLNRCPAALLPRVLLALVNRYEYRRIGSTYGKLSFSGVVRLFLWSCNCVVCIPNTPGSQELAWLSILFAPCAIQ